MMRPRTLAVVFVVVVGMSATVSSTLAQNVAGQLFEDRNDNGIRDPGEPALEGVPVRLFGTASGGAVDQILASAADGTFSFAPGNGCYLLSTDDPPGWRLGSVRSDGFDPSTPGYVAPVGQSRYSKLDRLTGNLESGSLVYSSIGDSIAYNFNICGYPEAFWYSKQIRSRIACAAPGAAITLNEAAIKGEHTDDLLVDEGGETNNLFRLLDLQPDLVTISMIGNDLLDVDPGNGATQTEINRAVAEVIDSRQNLQEVISTLLAELPDADVALNTLYDNEAYNCYSGGPSDFHRTWIPILNRMLRELAWGQTRRVTISEVAAEFAHEDQQLGCTGFDDLICRDFFLFDTIHPTNPGFTVVREKVWEAIGGVSLGSGDALGRSTVDNVDYGYLRRVRRLAPTEWQVRNGATVLDPEAAFDGDDAGLGARITLGVGDEEFRVGGFPDWYDEIRIVRVIAGVNYRTRGTVGDDFYRIEASLDGAFRPPPGFASTPTNWNFFTPLVGGGGPNSPAENPDYGSARVLAVPQLANYREVSAMFGKNPELPPGAAEYEWPAITHEELEQTELRVAAAPVAGTAGNDNYEVELDEAWLDLYGWEVPRPAEVQSLRVAQPGDGSVEVSFDTLTSAQRYNLYVGRIATVAAGAYDHGSTAPSGPDCAAPTQVEGGGRLKIVRDAGQQTGESVYYLVTAHVDDVESPAGFASDGSEIDRSASRCR
jgi:hypothetical protein